MVDCIDDKYSPLPIPSGKRSSSKKTCNAFTKVIVGDHNQPLWLISDCKSVDSVCSRHLCHTPISREMDHFSCQATFAMACVLNPSDDLGY